MIPKTSSLASTRRQFLRGLFPAGGLLCSGCGLLSASRRLQNNSQKKPAQHKFLEDSGLTMSEAFFVSLLLALLLTVSFSSCSRSNLADVVRQHIEAVNNDDIEINLTFFTDDAVFEPDPDTKLSGKAQVRNLMEWDVVNNARLSVKDLRVKGNTVIAELTERNEGWRLLGIDIPFTATYEFRGRQIGRVKLEFSPDSWKIFEDKFEPFAQWAKQAHTEEYQRMSEVGYSAEGARLFLSLAKEWRDKIDKEGVSVEQELIRLEKEANDAWLKRDVEAYARLLADDYLETGPDGDMATKAEELALVRSAETTITAVITDDFKVRVYGDAAVVTFRLTFKKPVDGKEMTGQERFTDTWIKRDGRWRCVAVHYSRIAQK